VFFFQAEDGIRDFHVTGVQTCALPIWTLIGDLESDRIERTTSFREDKLGPAVCSFSNDFPNHRQPGYILLGVNDDGSIAGIKIRSEERRVGKESEARRERADE